MTPEAVVVLPDGQVIYRGRIDDRYTSNGRRRAEPHVGELRSALEAIVADESPAVALTEPFGCPIPPRTTASAKTPSRSRLPSMWRQYFSRIVHRAIGPVKLARFRSSPTETRRNGLISFATWSLAARCRLGSRIPARACFWTRRGYR